MLFVFSCFSLFLNKFFSFLFLVLFCFGSVHFYGGSAKKQSVFFCKPIRRVEMNWRWQVKSNNRRGTPRVFWATHVSTYRSGTPIWKSCFLNPPQPTIAGIQEPVGCRRIPFDAPKSDMGIGDTQVGIPKTPPHIYPRSLRIRFRFVCSHFRRRSRRRCDRRGTWTWKAGAGSPFGSRKWAGGTRTQNKPPNFGSDSGRTRRSKTRWLATKANGPERRPLGFPDFGIPF